MKLAGRFGPYGGRYVPETLMAALEELEGAWGEVSADPEFMLELRAHQRAFVGRPTPLYAAERLTAHFGGAQIHLKREDLCHTGAHKLNNALGQAPRAGSRGWSWPASGAAPTRSGCSRPSSTTARSGWSASRPLAPASRAAATPRRSPEGGRACCTAATPTCFRTTTVRSCPPTRS